MQRKERAPVQVALPGASVKAELWANTSGAFASDSTRRPRARQVILCHRCRQPRARRGSISAAVISSHGHSARRYLCGRCCIELREGWRG